MAELSFKANPGLRVPALVKPQVEINGAYTVRAYRDNPDTVCLQLRMGRQYVSVSISFDDARKLGEHLISETKSASPSARARGGEDR